MDYALQLVIIFLVALIGSIHCTVMCCPLQKNVQSKQIFHLGRWGGYFLMWLILKMVSASLITQFGQPFFKVISIVLISWIFLEGLSLITKFRIPNFFRSMTLNNYFKKSFSFNLAQGFGLSLRGCGWMWSFVALAALDQNFLVGITKLFVFFLATQIPFLVFPLIEKQYSIGTKSRGLALIFLSIMQIYFSFGDGLKSLHQVQLSLFPNGQKVITPAICGQQ